MPRRAITIQPPLAGINRALAYQQQPPFTTPDAENTRGRGSLEHRRRASSRAGQGKLFSEVLGGGTISDATNASPIVITTSAAHGLTTGAVVGIHGVQGNTAANGVWRVTVVDADEFSLDNSVGNGAYTSDGDWGTPIRLVHPFVELNTTVKTFADDFTKLGKGDSIPSHWGAYSDATVSGDLPNISQIGLGLSAKYTGKKQWEIERRKPLPIDGAQEYTYIFSTINNSQATSDNSRRSRYYIDLRAPDTGDIDIGTNVDTLKVQIQKNGNRTVVNEISITERAGGVTTNLVTPNTLRLSPPDAEIRVKITPTTLDVSWHDSSGVLEGTQHTWVNATSDSRIGFRSHAFSNNKGGAPRGIIAYYQVRGNEETRGLDDRRYVSRMFASANGKLYRSSTEDQMTQITGLSFPTLNADERLFAVQRTTALYIADYGTARVENTVQSGAVAADGITLTDGAVADFTALGIDVDSDVCEIYDLVVPVGSDAEAKTVAIDSVAAGAVTLATSIGGDTACSYRIIRGPKVYDAASGTFSLWLPTLGSIPVGCKYIARYRDRMVLAGDPNNPLQWWMSRLSDPDDFNFGADPDDPAQAVSAATSESAGLIGEPITALITHSDDYFIIGCESSLYIVRGDPSYGGQIDKLSGTIGVVSGGAWCNTPTDDTILLGRDGIYFIPAGGSVYPKKISDEIPAELTDLDPQDLEICMNYDVREDGVRIFLTRREISQTTHWFLDLKNNKAYWRDTWVENKDPMSSTQYTIGGYKTVVATGCRDGAIREFDHTHAYDDDEAIDSYMFIGPLNIGVDGYHSGILTEITAVLDHESANVQWELFVGDDPEIALRSAPAAVGQWSLGDNVTSMPRVSGTSLFIKLKSIQDNPWALERIVAVTDRFGIRRVGTVL